MPVIPERSFERSVIVERLRGCVQRGEPIVAAAAGVGIIAKCAEIAGADLIFVLASGRSRHLGVPTTVNIGNATGMTLEMHPEIDNVVEKTPVVGGAEATDGTRRRLSRVVDEFRRVGFDGITNFPTTGTFPGWGEARKDVGEGTDREYELIELARRADMFTVGQAYTAEHAMGLAGSGADVLVARCGLTVGGLSGPSAAGATHTQAAEHLQEVIAAARAENPDVIALAHGGPFAGPGEVDVLYQQTDAQGVLGESSIERIPVEQYVSREVHSLKSQPLRKSAIAHVTN